MSSAYAINIRSRGGKALLVLHPHVAPILVGLAYFTLAHVGLGFASVNPSATPIWAPTGLAIAAVLVWGRHRIARDRYGCGLSD